MKSLRALSIPALLITFLVGCTPATPPQPASAALNIEPPSYVLIIVLDLSGSYVHYMNNGKAWNAVNKTIREFYRNRMGEHDKLVLGQISGRTVAPIFSGSPKAFGRECQSAGSFKELLSKQSDPAGSPVHASTEATLRYGMTFMSPTNSTFLAVFSDFDENFPEPQKTEASLVATLAEFAKKGGACGLYWLSLDQVTKWQENLTKAGFPANKMVVSGVIEAEPVFPHFD